jgi:hypothetical protein
VFVVGSVEAKKDAILLSIWFTENNSETSAPMLPLNPTELNLFVAVKEYLRDMCHDVVEIQGTVLLA